MVDTYIPPSYPCLRFIAVHGMKLAAVIASLVFLIAIVAAFGMHSWIAGAAALLGSVLLGGILASYVEMVRVIVDTLVPR